MGYDSACMRMQLVRLRMHHLLMPKLDATRHFQDTVLLQPA